MSPPAERPRHFTRPPAPPTTLEDRVRDLEHEKGAIERDLGDVAVDVSKIKSTLEDIKTTLTVLGTERTQEAKAHETKMKIVVGIAVSVSAGSLMTLAGWVIHLQNAMAAGGK